MFSVMFPRDRDVVTILLYLLGNWGQCHIGPINHRLAGGLGRGGLACVLLEQWKYSVHSCGVGYREKGGLTCHERLHR